MTQTKTAYLSGQLLVAMPGMPDPRFQRAVVYICAHDEGGAMGLIVNKPTPDLDFDALIAQLDLSTGPEATPVTVQFGGPVDVQRGFVLHSDEYEVTDVTLKVENGLALTSTIEVLEDIALGQGPNTCRLMLGYAGWGPGQLESELQRNDWLISPADAELVLEVPADAQWAKTLERLGIDVRLLSAGGSA